MVSYHIQLIEYGRPITVVVSVWAAKPADHITIDEIEAKKGAAHVEGAVLINGGIVRRSSRMTEIVDVANDCSPAQAGVEFHDAEGSGKHQA